MRNLGNNYKIFLKYDFSQMLRKFPQVDSLGHKWFPGKKKKKNKDVKLFSTFGRQCILCFLLGEMRCILACSGIYSPLQQEIWVFLKALLSQMYLTLEDFIGWYLLTSHKNCHLGNAGSENGKKDKLQLSDVDSSTREILRMSFSAVRISEVQAYERNLGAVWKNSGGMSVLICTHPTAWYVVWPDPCLPLGGTLCNWRKNPVFPSLNQMQKRGTKTCENWIVV